MDGLPADLADRVTALEGMLATLPVIEQAKSALMIIYGLTADDAFGVLRLHSQNSNIKIRDIAAELTRTAPRHPLTATASGELNRLLNTITADLLAAGNSGGARDRPPRHAGAEPPSSEPPSPTRAGPSSDPSGEPGRPGRDERPRH